MLYTQSDVAKKTRKTCRKYQFPEGTATVGLLVLIKIMFKDSLRRLFLDLSFSTQMPLEELGNINYQNAPYIFQKQHI